MSVRRLRVTPAAAAIPADRPGDKVTVPPDFARALVDALTYLYDPAYLQTNPLSRLAQRDRPANAKSRGEALRLVLLSAIEALRPEVDGGKHPVRCHELLNLRYVEGLEVAEVQKRLVISRRQYYREHERALEALVSLLQERWGPTETAPREEPLRLVSPPEASPSRLPAQPGRLIGREEELANARALLLQHEPPLRLLTLTGVGGSGKTRLALALAHAFAGAFPAGVHFIDLSGISDRALVLPTVARMLGVLDEGNCPVQESLARYVGDKSLLLVLDNCEQVAAAAPEVGALLERCPNLQVLATGRQPLRLRWEQEFPVLPLDLPDPSGPAEPNLLASVPSVDLFLERTRALKPEFRLTAENAGAVADICRRLDGLPLAIELAAARGRALSPQVILANLTPTLTFLRGHYQDRPARHQSLRTAIEWSYDLLSPAEQRLFRRLAVFAGGCTLEGAQAVSGEREPGETILEVLESLVEVNLVTVREGAEGTRFGLLDTIREYGLERLEAAGEGETVRRDHAEFFLAFAERAEPELTGARQKEWLERLEGEHDNLRAALGWAVAASDADLAPRFAAALTSFWNRHGHWHEGHRWLQAALDLCPTVPSPARARILRHLCFLSFEFGQLDIARRQGEEAVAVCRQVGYWQGAISALMTLGAVVDARGDRKQAHLLHDEAIALAGRSGDHWAEALAFDNKAKLASSEGDYQQARTLQERALAIYRQVGDEGYEVALLSDLAWTMASQGEFAEATTCAEQAIARGQELGGKEMGIGFARVTLGRLAAVRHDWTTAAGELAAGLHLVRGGCLSYVRAAFSASVDVAMGQKQWERVARLLGAVQRLREVSAVSPQDETARNAQAATSARAALGEANYNVQLQAGNDMSVEQAIDYAIGGLEAIRAG